MILLAASTTLSLAHEEDDGCGQEKSDRFSSDWKGGPVAS